LYLQFRLSTERLYYYIPFSVLVLRRPQKISPKFIAFCILRFYYFNFLFPFSAAPSGHEINIHCSKKWQQLLSITDNKSNKSYYTYVYLKITSQNYFNIWPLQNIKKRNIIIILVTENAFNRLKKNIVKNLHIV